MVPNSSSAMTNFTVVWHLCYSQIDFQFSWQSRFCISQDSFLSFLYWQEDLFWLLLRLHRAFKARIWLHRLVRTFKSSIWGRGGICIFVVRFVSLRIFCFLDSYTNCLVVTSQSTFKDSSKTSKYSHYFH